MEFGNWRITRTAIEWAANQGFQRFVVDTKSLLETITLQDDSDNLYKWIVLATEEDWLTTDDLYDFNFAFVYVAGTLQLPLDYALFDRTVAYQYDLLDDEENELG